MLELDITAPMEDLQDIAKRAVGIYGRVDVLVNNAGSNTGFLCPFQRSYNFWQDI